MRKQRKSCGLLFSAIAMAPLLPGMVNAQSYSRTEAISYHDNTSKWVLGQVASRAFDGVAVEQTSFDGNYAMPLQTWSFGKLKQTLTYNADGTVSTIKDGNNNVTSLSNWKRDVPRTVSYPNGTTQSAVVDDNGWITQVTDQNGFAKSFGYDAMGRLQTTTHPSGDTANWNVEYRSFGPSATAEYGLSAGFWRQIVTAGNYKKITYFDALWRPVIIQEEDVSNPAVTIRQTRMAYDHRGSKTYQSFPINPYVSGWSNYDAPLPGSWSDYDALGRVTESAQDSEHGLLITTTTYGKDAWGAYTNVRNPRGGETRTWYQMFDQPSYDAPTRIAQPEDVITTITRDIFGKPTAITRGNGSGSQQVTRSYAYNGYQELCRATEPETGATLMGYDDAGNLVWSASGVPSGAGCESGGWSAAVAPRRVGRSYDNMNRLYEIWFPDGRGNQRWSYHADGLPYQVWTNNINDGEQVINRYSYNKRRLLIHEAVEQPGWYLWGLSYGYDSSGNLASQGYPTGNVVTYSPNALGQPTLVADSGGSRLYASGISYYPNGALKSFAYGNNILHQMTQNARQLPIRSVDSGVLDLQTVFDANGNVQYIYDIARGTAFNRYLEYDALDRLTAAGSASFGGDHWHRFTYDAVDNLKSWKLGAGGKDYANYHYDPATNRLQSIQDSGGTTAVGLAYDVQGNLQNRNGQGYEFDFGNRLRGATGQEDYRYDAQGRRVFALRSAGNSLTVSQYSQSGQLMYYEKTGQPSLEHVYLAGSLLATRDTASNSVKFQHTDALGSPVAVTDGAGNVVERNDYEPYGAIIGKPAFDSVGFTGHKQDAATGLTYMQQRYYDSRIGQFLSVDPVTAYSNPIGAFNRYWYANNNPYRFTDPDGRQSKEKKGNFWIGGLRAVRDTIAPIAHAIVDPSGTNIDPSYDRIGPGPGQVEQGGYKFGSALAAAGGLRIPAKGAGNIVRTEVVLTGAQAKNLARFEGKLPTGNTGVSVTQAGSDAAFRSEVPGNVPGSSAVYEKTVNASGTTTSMTKTTVAPSGQVVHVKDKLN